jgi:hypothetical protein
MGFVRLRFIKGRGRAMAPLGGCRQPFAAESCHSLFPGWVVRGRQLPYVLDSQSLGFNCQAESEGTSLV